MNKNSVLQQSLSWVGRIGIWLVIVWPLFRMTKDFSTTSLRNENSVSRLAKGIFEHLPDGSLLLSPLVYWQVVPYYQQIEHLKKSLFVESPQRLLGRQPEESNPFHLEGWKKRREALNSFVLSALDDGVDIFLASDAIEQDKAPEPTLLADFEMRPEFPENLVKSMSQRIASELIPYRLLGWRKAELLSEIPLGLSPTPANEGQFEGKVKVLGIQMIHDPAFSFGRKRIRFNLVWKLLDAKETGFVGKIMLLDEKFRPLKIAGNSMWYRLGQGVNMTNRPSNTVIREPMTFYLPKLARGRYFLGLGLSDFKGQTIFFVPEQGNLSGREFEFALLLPLENR